MSDGIRTQHHSLVVITSYCIIEPNRVRCGRETFQCPLLVVFRSRVINFIHDQYMTYIIINYIKLTFKWNPSPYLVLYYCCRNLN